MSPRVRNQAQQRGEIKELMHLHPQHPQSPEDAHRVRQYLVLQRQCQRRHLLSEEYRMDGAQGSEHQEAAVREELGKCQLVYLHPTNRNFHINLE